MAARNDASVSIYLASSPLTSEHERIRLTLRNAIDDARRELQEAQVPERDIEKTLAPLRALDRDPEFWRQQANSLALFAADGELHSFRLANRVQNSVRVGDRYDLGALLRARTFPHGGYVLGLAVNDVRLWRLLSDAAAQEIELDLPADLSTVLEHAENFGQADLPRPRGNLGDRPEREKFARIVQEHVLAQLDGEHPLILAATPELEPAYRAVNTYRHLLADGINAHPSSLEPQDAERRARAILDATYEAQLKEWRENFGTARSNDRATSSLREVALAATAGQVADLHFDMDTDVEGEIDENGVITTVETPGPHTYAVVDEIAARVLQTGGRVSAVRQGDLLDDSPVAALLRAPRSALGLGES